eukprot:208731-Amphidinium_carterae.1
MAGGFNTIVLPSGNSALRNAPVKSREDKTCSSLFGEVVEDGEWGEHLLVCQDNKYLLTHVSISFVAVSP